MSARTEFLEILASNVHLVTLSRDEHRWTRCGPSHAPLWQLALCVDFTSPRMVEGVEDKLSTVLSGVGPTRARAIEQAYRAALEYLRKVVLVHFRRVLTPRPREFRQEYDGCPVELDFVDISNNSDVSARTRAVLAQNYNVADHFDGDSPEILAAVRPFANWPSQLKDDLLRWHHCTPQEFEALPYAQVLATLAAYVHRAAGTGSLEADAKSHNKRMHASNGNATTIKVSPGAATPVKLARGGKGFNKRKNPTKAFAPRKQKGKKGRATHPVGRAFSRKDVQVAISSNRETNRKDVADFLHSIVLPIEAPDFRMPSNWSTVPTTLMKPFSKPVAPFVNMYSVANTGVNSRQTLPNTEMMAFVSRNPAAAIRYYDANPNSLRLAYLGRGSAGIGIKETPPASTWTHIYNNGVVPDKTYLHVPYWIADPNYFNPYGDAIYAGSAGAGAGRYIWMNRYDEIIIGIQASGGVGSLRVGLDEYDHGGGINVNVETESSVVAPNTPVESVLVAPGDGWYAPWFGSSIADVASYTNVVIDYCNLTGSATTNKRGGVWCQKSIPNLTQIVGSMPSMCIRGVSIEYSNTQAVIELGGKIAQMQLPKGNHWEEYVYPDAGTPGAWSPPAVSSSFGFGLLNGNKDVDTKVATRGSYAFTKPTEDSSLAFMTQFAVEDGVLYDSKWDLTRDYDTVAWAYSGPVAGQDGYWTFGYNIEAVTTDTTRPTDVSRADPLCIFEAQAVLRRMNQYGENPTHLLAMLSQVLRGANWVASKVIEAAPRVVQAAKFVKGATSAF